jgi:hypothetical protein
LSEFRVYESQFKSQKRLNIPRFWLLYFVFFPNKRQTFTKNLITYFLVMLVENLPKSTIPQLVLPIINSVEWLEVQDVDIAVLNCIKYVILNLTPYPLSFKGKGIMVPLSS